MKINFKKGQQEMVGFVLIVVLVVVGLMVFLIISVTSEPKSTKNLEVDNLLNSIFKHTTECAIVFEPNYDNFEDLFKSCYQGKECSNIGIDACEYLETSLREIMDDSLNSLADVNYYQLLFSSKDGDGWEGIFKIEEGECTGTSKMGASRILRSLGGDELLVSIELCRDV
ncbi:MAG: hypothetical protein IH845_01690 [Nanoarchaeota archaeon]|nr:hypothetical protein [Nanoarchaeota archaeon]